MFSQRIKASTNDSTAYSPLLGQRRSRVVVGGQVVGGQEGTRRFGSAHTAGCYFAFADGSVALISYEIDREVHRRHGSRRDGEIVL